MAKTIVSTDNTYQNADEIADTALVYFQNYLKIIATAYKDYQKDIMGGMTDRGGTITIIDPLRYVAGETEEISTVPSITEKYVTLTVNKIANVCGHFTARDLTLYARKDFDKRFIAPMARQLADKVESVVGQEIANRICYFKGTAGTAPANYKALMQPGVLMTKLGIQPTDRWLELAPDDALEVKSYAGFQNASSFRELSKDITRQGQLGVIGNFQTYESVHTGKIGAGVGDNVSTPSGGFVAAGTTQSSVSSGNTIIVQGLVDGTQAFKQYDKIFVKSAYIVNKLSRESIGEFASFTILNDPGTSGTTRTLTVYPEIITDPTNPDRNLTNAIAASAEVFLATAATAPGEINIPYNVNTAYIPQAVLFAAPPMITPRSVVWGATRTDEQTGVSLRLVETFDGLTNKSFVRMDVIYGVSIIADRLVGLLGGRAIQL
ncbi:MAG: P22 phage major capsid protein family protein [Candidatus Hodarchaeota archaeon]